MMDFHWMLITTTALLLSIPVRPISSLGTRTELVSGDVMLGALLSINKIRDDACGDYDVDSLKEVTAVKWFLDRLNENNYIPGVKIGLDVYRTCQSGEQAVKNTVLMLEHFDVLIQDAQNVNSTKPLFGVLGPGRTQDAMAVSHFLSSLPLSQRPLQISGSATGADLSNKGLYSNFFRVIPPDSTQVQVLSHLLQQLGWNYISIVYDNDAYGRQAALELRDLVTARELCVPSFESLPLDYKSTDFVTAADAIIDRIRGGDSSVITGVVYIGGAATAREFVSRLATRVSFVRFIFSEAVGLQTSVVSQTTLGKGALVAAPPYLPLPEFKTYWNSLWTNWTFFSSEIKKNAILADYYVTLTGCSIDTLDCYRDSKERLPLIEDDTQWLFEYYHVKATAVLAAILKQLHLQTCVRATASGVCLALKRKIRNDRGSIQSIVETVSFNLESEFSGVSSVFVGQTNVGFDQEGEATNGALNESLYNVFNYRECVGPNFCFQKVGSYYLNGRLQLDTEKIRGYDEGENSQSWSQIPKAQCMDNHDCLECLPPDIPGDMVFVPGDVYVVAVAPVHNKEARRPLQCGTIRHSAGADFVQSVLFAVQQINKKNAPFNNVFGSKYLGVLILNSCVRELVIKEKLIELHQGSLVLPDGRNSSDILPQIAGYVGGFFSSVSIAMYEVLASLDTRFVLLSPANTSPELSDRKKYPLYMRLTTGQNTQVNGLLSIVRELGHQYVQVLYDPDDNYSNTLKERINALSMTGSFNICVVNSVASDSEGQSFYTVLDDMRKNLWAPLVIVTLQVTHIKKVMDDILPQMTASDRFLFLGTDAWARNKDVLTAQGSGKLLGSLVMSVELPFNQLFGEYLKDSDPLKTANPWLKYFWEARENCYFDGSFRRLGKAGQCPQADQLTDSYVQDPWVPFYINAVFAFALGLDSALTQHCGQSHQGFLCTALTSQQLVDSLKEVRLDLFNNGRDVSVFDDNGDGDIGFELFEITYDSLSSVQGALTYSEVGRFDHGTLQLNDKSNLWVIKNLPPSKCPNSNACNACFSNKTESGAQTGNDGGDSSNTGAIIGLVVVIVILIVVIVVLVVLGLRRLRTQRSNNNNQKFGLDNMAAMTPGSEVNTRPLPPVHSHSVPGEFVHQTSVTSGPTDDSSSNSQYDYLHHDIGSRPHSYARHPMPTHGSGNGSAGSHSSQQSYLPMNSGGYVPRNSGGQVSSNQGAGVLPRQNSQVRNSYDIALNLAAAPQNSQERSSYDIAASVPARQNSRDPKPSDEAMDLSLKQNNLNDGAVGGTARQNSIPYSAPRDSTSDLGQAPSLPLKFENDTDPSYLNPPAPQPHQSVRESGYLTPVGERPESGYMEPIGEGPNGGYLSPVGEQSSAQDRNSYMDMEGTTGN